MNAPIQLINVVRHYRGYLHQNEAIAYLQSAVPPAVLAEFAKRWRSQPARVELVTINDLLMITTAAPRATLLKFLKPLNEGFEQFDIKTPLQIAHFLAQALHESAEFQLLEEGSSGEQYEGRIKDLGNTQKGDGRRYKGRGIFQITGRANHEALSEATGIDYVTNPERLLELPDCVNSAFWFWNTRSLSKLADADNFDEICLTINGGWNGKSDRAKYLKRAKEVLI